MADKQLARSENADFNVLADDDPLAELARIVGYDNRPAVQQLQELERHRESVRREPVINLEDELLREFDAYDAPSAVVDPEPDMSRHQEPQHRPAVEEVPPAALPHVALEEPVELQVAPAISVVEPSAEVLPEQAAIDHAPVEPAAADVPELSFDAVDLERELEMSVSYADYYGQTEDVAQVAQVVQAAAPEQSQDVVVPDVRADDAVAPIDVDPVEASVSAVAEQAASVVADRPEPVKPAGSGDVSMSPIAGDAQGVDDLLADIARFPVPPVPSARIAAVTEPARKVNYPFTPTFSRATPVASGNGSQRAFATPLAANPVTPAMTAPVAAAVPSPAEAFVAPVITEAAPQLKAAVDQEPDFDLDSFELDLSDIDLSVDLADFEPVPQEPAVVAPAAMEFVEPQPVHVQQPVEQFVPDHDDADIEPEGMMPFDPAMIAETEENPVAITDLHVPQLPVVEQERPVAHHPDYDLDLDAEMAQLFATPGANAPIQDAPAGTVLPLSSKTPTTGETSHVEEDFEEFEKAMEADFRLSLSQRHDTDPSMDRLAVGSGYVPDTQYEAEDEGRGKRRLMLMAAAVVGLAVFGGAGVYAFMGSNGATMASGEPQIILADKSPVKMVPLEKGGKTVPNQDKAVYDRVAGAQDTPPSQDTLVSSTEEPMDVVQRTLTPETLPLEGAGEEFPGLTPIDEDASSRLPADIETAERDGAEESAPAVSPRKVRTMIVKPDGTLVAREEPAVQPSQDVAADQGDPQVKMVKTTAITSPVETGSTPNALPVSENVAESAQKSALEQAADATVEEVAPVRSVRTSAVADPIPETRPVVEQAEAVDTFKTEPAQQPVEAAPVVTAAVAPGSYVVQIASLPSEADAQRSYQSLSGKFSGVIGGKGVDIKRAEIAGKGTYYRVRIPAGTREAANTLCARYKSAGGSCLVTK